MFSRNFRIMKKRTIEISVGIFVFLGLLSVAYLTIKLGRMDLLGSEYYQLSGRFASVSGLKEGSVVEMAGVQIGQVTKIELNTDRMVAVIKMKIRQDVPLTEDVIASVKTMGLIGDKYVNISPGGSDIFLENGDEIEMTESAIDLESLISKYAFGEV